jgi:hypothetical protein
MRHLKLVDLPPRQADGRGSREMRSRWKLRPTTREAYYQHAMHVALGILTTITISMFYLRPTVPFI